MTIVLLREAIRLVLESTERHCRFYKASDDKWYLELADKLHQPRSKATTYGPFASYDSAERYLDNFGSSPGSWSKDGSGRLPPPKKSPNGRPVHATPTRELSLFGMGRLYEAIRLMIEEADDRLLHQKNSWE